MNWYEYISANNPWGVNQVARKYGIRPPGSDPRECAGCALALIEQFGDEAIIDLLKQHPDFGAIKEIVLKEKKGSWRNADGDQPGSSTKEETTWEKIQSFVKLNDLEKANTRTNQLLLAGGSVALALLLFKVFK
jgi:hypothetical protein